MALPAAWRAVLLSLNGLIDTCGEASSVASPARLSQATPAEKEKMIPRFPFAFFNNMVKDG